MSSSVVLQQAISERAVVPFSDQLSGANAFYNKGDYVDTTRQEMAQSSTVPAVYTIENESCYERWGKRLLAVIIFPIGLYNLIHWIAGRILVLSSNWPKPEASVELNSEWKYKRIAIEVDGYTIDAVIMGQAHTLANRKWMLVSHGNNAFYEHLLSNRGETLPYRQEYHAMLSALKANAIVFNYPGAGASSGPVSREALAKAYRAVLRFLEDEERGIGAKEIIGYSHSLGGAVQADALKDHQLNDKIKYVFVKRQTFATLSEIAAEHAGSFVGKLIQWFGWDIRSIDYSEQLEVPEIIIHTAEPRPPRPPGAGRSAEDLQRGIPERLWTAKEVRRLKGDGVISAESSLARAVLASGKCMNKRHPDHNLLLSKMVIGIEETHNKPLNHPHRIAEFINSQLHPNSI
jgi:Chlamydia CHLPS protein (DUF818).